MTLSRRNFVKQGLALTFTVAGKPLLLTPREAHAAEVPFSVLSAQEAGTLRAVCEGLAPGAAEGGAAHFVDQQLGVDPDHSLLFIKYFNVQPPYVDFYRAALSAIRRLSEATFGAQVAALKAEDAKALLQSLRDDKAADWDGPPAPLVYQVLRNDAVDVVYGDKEGFASLDLPYLAHIEPPPAWRQ